MDDDRKPAPTAANKSMIGLQRWPPVVVRREHGYRRAAAAHRTQYLRKMAICSLKKEVVHGSWFMVHGSWVMGGRLTSALIETLSVSCSRLSMSKMYLNSLL